MTVYHPLIMEKSRSVSTPFVVNSSTNEVIVRFTSSDVGKSFNGFLAVYSVVDVELNTAYEWIKLSYKKGV